MPDSASGLINLPRSEIETAVGIKIGQSCPDKNDAFFDFGTLNIKIYHGGFRGPTMHRMRKDPMGRARYLLL